MFISPAAALMTNLCMLALKTTELLPILLGFFSTFILKSHHLRLKKIHLGVPSTEHDTKNLFTMVTMLNEHLLLPLLTLWADP